MQGKTRTAILLALLMVLALGFVPNAQRTHAQDGQPVLAALVADPYEPNNDPPSATWISCSATTSGAVIQPGGDLDYYRFTGLAGQVIVADIDAWQTDGSPLDSVLTLFDSNGTSILDENDDMAVGSYDSRMEISLPHDGTFYLLVQDWTTWAGYGPPQGGPSYIYTLSLVCNGPREIAVTPEAIDGHLSPGGTDTATVTIQNSLSGGLNWRITEQDTTPGAPALTSPGGTVQILSWVRFTGYSEFSDPEYAHTLEAIAQYFTDFTVTESNALDPAALAEALVGKDALLLPEPNQGTTEALQAAGTALQATLHAFVSSGGTIIATCEWEWWQGFLRSAALMDVQWSHDPSTGPLNVVDGTHPLAVGLGTTVQLANATAAYIIGNADAQIVVTAPGGQPVVAARNIGAGHVVLIGYDYNSYNNDAARIIANAVQWAQSKPDVPWLSVATTSGTVSGAGSQNVIVHLDAAGLAAGTYTANLLILNNDTNETLVTVPVTLQVAGAGAKARSDIDGDGRTDLVIYRPSVSAWFALKSSTSYDTGSPFAQAWGVEGDIPLSGDLDGDDKMDLIVYRPAYGVWFGLLSSTGYDEGSYFVQGWGIPGDQPLSGDVDGDGKMDLVIYRPSAGVWFVLESSTNYSTVFARAWGMEGDIPVSGDLDGDGKMDLIVYRPAYGVWFGLLSSADYDPASYFVQGWGIPGDQPLSGDVDGDGKMDLVIYRPSYGVWFALLSASDYTTTFGKAWGVAGDIPVSGDLDGDGKMDLIVYRPTYGVWFGLTSSTNYDYGAYFVKGWGGMSGDTPNP